MTASIEQRSAPKGSFPTCCQTPGTTFERPCSPSRCSPGSRSVCTRVPACKFTSTLARKMHDNYPQPVGPFVVHQSTAARMAFQLQAITIPLARHPSFRRNRTLRTIDIFLFLSLSLLAVFFAAFFFLLLFHFSLATNERTSNGLSLCGADGADARFHWSPRFAVCVTRPAT